MASEMFERQFTENQSTINRGHGYAYFKSFMEDEGDDYTATNFYFICFG